MTDLLTELEAVVALLDAPDNDLYAEATYKAARFIRAHNAEIAEAVMDARRYRWLKYNATELTGEYGEAAQLYYGTYRSGPLELDASIDAAMHNSAREVGE